MRLILITVALYLFWLALSGHYEPWFMVSALGREGTWPIVLRIQQFFDDKKAAELEAANEAAARAEMSRNA